MASNPNISKAEKNIHFRTHRSVSQLAQNWLRLRVDFKSASQCLSSECVGRRDGSELRHVLLRATAAHKKIGPTLRAGFKPVLTSHLQTFPWPKKVNGQDQRKGLDKYNPLVRHRATIETRMCNTATADGTINTRTLIHHICCISRVVTSTEDAAVLPTGKPTAQLGFKLQEEHKTMVESQQWIDECLL